MDTICITIDTASLKCSGAKIVKTRHLYTEVDFRSRPNCLRTPHASNLRSRVNWIDIQLFHLALSFVLEQHSWRKALLSESLTESLIRRGMFGPIPTDMEIPHFVYFYARIPFVINLSLPLMRECHSSNSLCSCRALIPHNSETKPPKPFFSVTNIWKYRPSSVRWMNKYIKTIRPIFISRERITNIE